jgi:hypothetical protein
MKSVSAFQSTFASVFCGAIAIATLFCGFPTAASAAVNLALNGTASADASQSGNGAGNAIDGSVSTRWCATDGNTGHWWKVDLGAVYTLGGYQIVWEMAGDSYQYLVEVSNDDVTYTTALDKTSNAETAQVQTENFTGTVKGRFVRITVTGLSSGSWASFYECSVFGVAGTTPAPAINNLALVGSSSSDGDQGGNPSSNAIDATASTRWCATDGNTGHWWKVDLGAVYNLNGCQIIWEFNGDYYQFLVEVSNDDNTYTTALDQTANTSISNQIQSYDFLSGTKGRYVRITVTGLSNNHWASFYEFGVFGSTPTTGLLHTGLNASAVASALSVSNKASDNGAVLHYAVPSGSASRVDMRLFDLKGIERRTLVNGMLPSGRYSLAFDNRDGQGRRLAAGTYLCRYRVISGNGLVDTRAATVTVNR